MKKAILAVLALCAVALVAFSPVLASQETQAAQETPGAASPVHAIDEKPLTQLPYTPSLDVSAMDKSVDPCTDFYSYSCGGWKQHNPIPPDQARWSVYGKLYNDNQRFLWGILDALAKETSGRTADQQKIGDYFSACMDESRNEQLGVMPLKPALDQIAAITDKRQLAGLVAKQHMQLSSFGYQLMFGMGSDQDFDDATQVITFAEAGGLGLPDRDYYTKTDAKSKDLRDKYVEHVTRMLQLLGDSPEAARREADAVMRIETAFAQASLTRVERRNPYNLKHKMTRVQLQQLTPSFDWSAYFTTSGLPSVQTINVTQPAFFQQLEKQIQSTSLDDWKAYLRWHAVHAEAPYLSSKFVNENFDFFSRTLRGVQQLPARWKRCVSGVDHQLGEALGQEFVRRTFPPEMKSATVRMTKQIQDAMEQDIKELTWMSPATREQALAKLHLMVNKIGYPEKWRDYSSVVIKRDDFLGNVQRATEFERRRDLNKIGKPLDRTEWGMTPPTVNAYYNPQMNDINFPAGVLQPPLYDPKLDDAPNYGNTGSTIGHELTHGFDDEGRQFDAHGNLRDWWTKQDAEEFTKRAECVVNQYAKYVVVDDIHINSKLTEGEDVADLGGTILALAAWRAETANKKLQNIEGFTPEQRFFIGLAQWACENARPEDQRANAITDPHSPGQYRINGVVVNLPEFQQAFSCKAGSPMTREDRCRVW
jgi:endothelin-converting enzyme/putative endopeptidase